MVQDELAVGRLGVMAALGAGDAGLAYRLVLGLMDDGHPFPVILEQVLAPIQWESGHRWELGDFRISDEHASTSTIETVVALLAGSFQQSDDDRSVIVACAEGETHTLPARMAAALLTYEGYRTIFLGASLPASDLGDFLATTKPDVLVVSCTRPANLRGARACIVAGHEAGVPVVVGGRAFGDGGERARVLGADAYAPSLSGLVEIVEDVELDPRSSGGVPARPDEPAAPDPSVRVSIVTRLAALLVDDHSPDPTTERVVAESAEDLVDTLVVARSLDDATLLADQARWLARILVGQTALSVPADQLLVHLRAVTAPTLPGAEPLIVASIESLRSES